MKQIKHEGDVWNLLSEGSTREDGKTYCHLASTTRVVKQRNGSYPVQIADWIDEDSRCPTCGEDGGTSCGMPNCGLLA